MKIARLIESDKETYGIVKDGKVATKDEIINKTGVPLPQTIKEFCFNGWLDEIKDEIGNFEYGYNIEELQILAPIPNPPKILCLAFNYLDHASEQNLEPPKDPVIVMKPRTALCGTNSEIICPDFITQLDYEIELAVIIGKKCKNISENEAKETIFGYTILNDVSARDIQFKDGQFTRAKSFDTFAPCGPWITTHDEVPFPNNLKLVTKINGEMRQNSSTEKMFIKIPQIISKLSKVMTLENGDIISTGTPAGVALKNPEFGFLEDGDKIEMEIEGLGILKNTIRFEISQ